jgi:hypothetical protein
MFGFAAVLYALCRPRCKIGLDWVQGLPELRPMNFIPEYFATFVVTFERRSENNFLVDFALLGYYAASVGNKLPKFRDSLSVPSSRIKQSKFGLLYPAHLHRDVSLKSQIISLI